MAHSVGRHCFGDRANAYRSFKCGTPGTIGGILRPIKPGSSTTLSTQSRSMACDASCMSDDTFGNFDIPNCECSRA